jgi:hypothetical protein
MLIRKNLIWVPVFLLLIASGCGGKKPSTNSTASSINISPSSLDMNVGSITSITAQVLNSSGSALSPQPTITYTSSDASAVTVSPKGEVCAGVWDVNFITCRNGTVPSNAVTVTASADGVSASISVFVHLKIDRITLSAPQVQCVPQNQSLQFTATAFSNGVDVTSSVSSFSWNITDSTVAQVNSSGLAVSRMPGIANVYVTAANTTSTSLAFVACPAKSIQLSQVDTSNTTFALNKGDTVSLLATVTDTLGNPVNGVQLSFSSSQSAVARVTANGVVQATVSALAAGNFTIVASCTPSTCDNGPPGIINTPSGPTTALALGFGYPIYSNLVKGTVAGTSATTVYVTGNAYPDGHTNHQLRIYDSNTLNQQTSIELPYVPNSMLFDPQGSKAYLGSSDGTDGDAMMIFDPSSNTVSTFSGSITNSSTITKVTGKVLAISPDGNKIVVSDTVNSRVFVVNASQSSAQVFSAPGVQSASFSPDSFKAFLAGANGVFEYTTSLHSVATVNLSASSSVAYTPDGPLAFVSGSALTSYATCNDKASGQLNVAAGPITAIYPSKGTELIGISGSSWLDVAAVLDGNSCPASVNASFTTTPYSSCTINQIVPLPDGSRVFASAMDAQSCSPLTSIPFYDVTNPAAGSVSLATAAVPVGAAVTLDSDQLYLGTQSQDSASVHFIDLTTNADSVQVDVPFVPSVIAVWPK